MVRRAKPHASHHAPREVLTSRHRVCAAKTRCFACFCVFSYLSFSKRVSRILPRIPQQIPRAPCIPRFLKDLAVLHHASWRAHRAFPCKYRVSRYIYGFLKDLAKTWRESHHAEIAVFGVFLPALLRSFSGCGRAGFRESPARLALERLAGGTRGQRVLKADQSLCIGHD